MSTKNRISKKAQRNVIFFTLILSFITLLFLCYRPEQTQSGILDQYLPPTKQTWAGWMGSNEEDLGYGGDDENAGCIGWDHEGLEVDDPEKCLMARQYRQVARVLAREELAEQYFPLSHPRTVLMFLYLSPHWYFTLNHNKATLTHLLRCFTPPSHPDHLSCPPRPLVICGWWYCAETLTHATTGEVVWMSSVLDQLKSLDIQFLAVGPYENWIEVVEMMPDV
jgi:hypothetical protein